MSYFVSGDQRGYYLLSPVTQGVVPKIRLLLLGAEPMGRFSRDTNVSFSSQGNRVFSARYGSREAPGSGIDPETDRGTLYPHPLGHFGGCDGLEHRGGQVNGKILLCRLWGKRSMVPSIVTFSDVKDAPSIRMELPALLPLGERIKLRVTLRRKNGHRTEELRVDGEYRVAETSVDATYAPPKQIVKVEATKVAPAWKAVRNPSPLRRLLPPTHSKAVLDE